MIQAGSKVRVIDWGRNCSTFIEWFKRNADSLPIEYVARYAYDDSSKFETEQYSDKTIYRVLFVAGCHALIIRDYLALPPVGYKTYLLSINGLEECVDKSQLKDMLKSMSIREIREIIDEIITDNTKD